MFYVVTLPLTIAMLLVLALHSGSRVRTHREKSLSLHRFQLSLAGIQLRWRRRCAEKPRGSDTRLRSWRKDEWRRSAGWRSRENHTGLGGDRAWAWAWEGEAEAEGAESRKSKK